MTEPRVEAVTGAAVGQYLAALAVLRSRERKKERFIGSWIKAIDAETARQVIYDHLQPRTDKTGSVWGEPGSAAMTDRAAQTP